MAYNRADKELAMTALVAHAGSAGLTHVFLKEQHALNVRPETLRKWRTSEMREFYAGLLESQGDMTQQVINETLETARLAAQAERLAVERAMTELAQGTCKDPAKTARDLSQIKTMNIEKYLTLIGKPTRIIEVSNPDDALLELARMGVLKPATDADAFDGECYELPPEVAGLIDAASSTDESATSVQ